MNIKKIFLSVLFTISLGFGADKTIIIGATPTPYAEILKFFRCYCFSSYGYIF